VYSLASGGANSNSRAAGHSDDVQIYREPVAGAGGAH